MSKAVSSITSPKKLWYRSPLIIRILAVNALSLAILVGSFLYFEQYQDSLIEAELQNLEIQTNVFSGVLAEGATEITEKVDHKLSEKLTKPLMKRLIEATNLAAQIYTPSGKLIVDSRILQGPGGLITVEQLPPLGEKVFISHFFSSLSGVLEVIFPEKKKIPVYKELSFDPQFDDEIKFVFEGETVRSVRQNKQGTLVLIVAQPIKIYKQILGILVLTKDLNDLNFRLNSLRYELLKIFLISLGLTILLSIFLARSIVLPIHELAQATRKLRRDKNPKDVLPSFPKRRDEIKELAIALKESTQALWSRMGDIENFAADVTHEIKNPLTSIKSAIETIRKIDNEEERSKLLNIIYDDLKRVDRLITDISHASRIDMEVSSSKQEPVALDDLIQTLIDIYQNTGKEGLPSFEIIKQKTALYNVMGNDVQLMQVFQNLIENAISFSEPQNKIRIELLKKGLSIQIYIEDEGQGIDPASGDKIFERFYTHRSGKEEFGNHSGLGLSIVKQILIAHKGEIETIPPKDPRKKLKGACFLVTLPAIKKG